MAIDDYACLLLEAGDYSGRADIAQHFDRFLRLAEAKLNRALRVGEMEVEADLSVIDGAAALPADFLEARAVLHPSGRPLRAVSLPVLSARQDTAGGIPDAYAIIGSTLSVRPRWSGDLALTYYGAIPPLTRQNPTNWLLATAPDVYLYALCEEIGIRERDPAKVAGAQGLRVQAMAGLSLLDERRRWGNARLSTGGLTP
ncbi:phage adaptor protein [Shinella sp. G-2]|uniref:phage adaptor protein n=1 Tax=Shinella sp. G-2 TaxID=3133141 RepID=UPI003CFE62D5